MRAAKIRCGFGVAAFGFDRARDYFAFAEQCEAGGVDSLWQTDRPCCSHRETIPGCSQDNASWPAK